MTKKMISWLAFMSVFSVLLYSCRTDEAIQEQEHQQKEKIAAFERFEKEHSRELTDFKNRYAKGEENTEFSYADPFSSIIYNFIVKHPDFYKQLYDDFGSIDYNVSSQTFGTTNKYILYPILKEGVVTALWYGKINEDRSWVDFYLVNNQSALAQSIISEFQQHYAQHQQTARGESDPPIKDIEEVIITVHTTGEAPIPEVIINTGGYSPPYTGDMSGGPILHGGGGWAPQTPQNNQTPCEKTKNLLTKPDVQAVVSNLKNHLSSGAGGEKGWKFNKVGNPTETSNNSEHSVTVGDPSLINGTYHNHTGTKVDIFSATDIATLIEIARYQSIGNAGNAFSGLVAPNGIHYVIYFNGSHADLPPSGSYSETDKDVWNIQMWRLQQKLIKENDYYDNINGKKVINTKGLEVIFFDTIKKMGLNSKIILQKIDNLTNNITTVTQNSDGTIIPVPCNN